MRIITDIKELKNIPVTSISIGVFDGVHFAHRVIIKELIKAPPSLIITFDRHPKEIIGEPPKLLTNLDERIKMLEELGIENLFILKFDKKLSNMKAEKFITWLFSYIHPKRIILGYNHRFGHNAEGGYELLVEFSKKYKYEIERLSPICLDGVPISSTLIRNLISDGKVSDAEKYLSYRYSFSSTVIEGDNIGKSLGYPTANLKLLEKKLLPKSGVYAVNVEYNGKKYNGMLSIGDKPTFNKPYSIEVHIFDFNEHIVGKEIRVEFVKYLRENYKFNGIGEMKAQLKKDEEMARKILK